MKQICFILDWYPTKTNNGCVFAKHLICAIADCGFNCVVIAPRIKNAATEKIPYFREDVTEKGSVIKVFTPTYYHFSSRKQTMKLSMNNHLKAVIKTLKKENLHPDIVYGHFIYQCGLTAARVGEKLGVPSYCACGENSLRLIKNSEPYSTGLKYCDWNAILSLLSGIVSVSGFNRSLLLENGFVDNDMPIEVFPNGFNKNKFYVMDQHQARLQLELPEDKFIVAFTGTFKESKGVRELCAALNQLDEVYSLFIGKGDLKPDCKNILFCDSVPNDDLHTYLNAADVFVLPTKGEGCCNAIVEALACGLPVISSDLAFNDDVLNEKNSIRINVEDENQIADAIMKLKEDTNLKMMLAQGAVDFSKSLSITERAKNILKFMRLI